MKTWYFAKCDKCGEAMNMFVNNIATTNHYLIGDNERIGEFMSRHWGCELTLGWRDDQLDQLWDEGYLADYSKGSATTYIRCK